jgi:hypothetical protein
LEVFVPACGIETSVRRTGISIILRLCAERCRIVPLTIWYNWQEPITPWHSFGLLDVRGRPKLAYDALARQRTETDRRDARQPMTDGVPNRVPR